MRAFAFFVSILLPLALFVESSSVYSDNYQIQTGVATSCGSSSNVNVNYFNVVCANETSGSGYCNIGDTVIVSVSVTYDNLSSSNAYLTIKGSYKPCSWHVVKNQPIDLCQDATSEGGATCPGDGTYTMEVAEIKLDEGFADFSDQNITFTFTFADDNGNEIGCTSNNVIYSSAQVDNTVEAEETQFAATEEETAEADETQEIDEMEEENAEAMGSGTYISMTAAAFVGVALSASLYRVRTQRRMSILDTDDKKVPFTVDMTSLA